MSLGVLYNFSMETNKPIEFKKSTGSNLRPVDTRQYLQIREMSHDSDGHNRFADAVTELSEPKIWVL